MATEVPLLCSCGLVRGSATLAATHNRIVCMCRDCQTYAHFLDRAADILDEHGGSDVYALTPSQLRITEGTEQLRCVRLHAKGMMRWYTDCCRTPDQRQLLLPVSDN